MKSIPKISWSFSKVDYDSCLMVVSSDPDPYMEPYMDHSYRSLQGRFQKTICLMVVSLVSQGFFKGSF